MIDLNARPVDTKVRVPFQIAIGPTTKVRKTIADLLPRFDTTLPIPQAPEFKREMQQYRASLQNTVKEKIAQYLGDKTPAWFEKVGRNGLRKMLLSEEWDEGVKGIILAWKKRDEEYGQLVTEFSSSITARIEYGHQQVAHDVCRHLSAVKLNLLHVEENFLAAVSRKHDNEDAEVHKLAQKYRHFSATKKLISLLITISKEYGIVVREGRCAY